MPTPHEQLQLTPSQEQRLLHMLGIRPDKWPTLYRNGYSTGAADNPDLMALVEMGLVVEHQPFAERLGASRRFSATQEGKAVAIRAWQRIRLSPAQMRYRIWLEIRDLSPEVSFRDFLTNAEWASARLEANGPSLEELEAIARRK